ncbi:MAG: ribosomal-protein-alanine N-acetyltransferase [Chloroflexi bacterium]|nr:MAG: ribosomal-protein-alanine N-acetyltransferase [Chloroflexota bacterium]
MTLTLRYMRLDDVPEVAKIDRQSFSMPWSEQSYRYEVGEAPYSYMVVLEESRTNSTGGLRGIFNRIQGTSPIQVQRQIVGYGGLWNIADEAHISTIATHPKYRGHGYGALLLAAMVQKSIALHAAYVVLEVRMSNTIAQNLYLKYGFRKVMIKPGYYHDNGEDAYDMRLDLEDEAAVRHFKARYAEISHRFDLIDDYTDKPHPRHSQMLKR